MRMDPLTIMDVGGGDSRLWMDFRPYAVRL